MHVQEDLRIYNTELGYLVFVQIETESTISIHSAPLHYVLGKSGVQPKKSIVLCQLLVSTTQLIQSLCLSSGRGSLVQYII